MQARYTLFQVNKRDLTSRELSSNPSIRNNYAFHVSLLEGALRNSQWYSNLDGSSVRAIENIYCTFDETNDPTRLTLIIGYTLNGNEMMVHSFVPAGLFEELGEEARLTTPFTLNTQEQRVNFWDWHYRNNRGEWDNQARGFAYDAWRNIWHDNLRRHGDYIRPDYMGGRQNNQNNQNNINYGQSVHNEEVHQSVSTSLRKLDARYGKKLNQATCLQGLFNFVDQLRKSSNDQNKNQTELHEIAAAIRCLERLLRTEWFTNVERGSGFDFRKVISLIWTAIQDNETLTVPKEQALERFVHHLYLIQRGYNLDENGQDNMRPKDKFICVGGTFNQIVCCLNGGLHPDVEIIFATKQTAMAKLRAIVYELVVDYIMNEAESKEKLIESLRQICDNPNETLPEWLFNNVKEKATKALLSDYEGLLSESELNEVIEFGGPAIDVNHRLIQLIDVACKRQQVATTSSGTHKDKEKEKEKETETETVQDDATPSGDLSQMPPLVSEEEFIRNQNQKSQTTSTTAKPSQLGYFAVSNCRSQQAIAHSSAKPAPSNQKRNRPALPDDFDGSRMSGGRNNSSCMLQ
ncbi:hypothetical protein AQUSIP_15730 [Aquicella siphonis]|uniref:Uncharacterized protein n=1 Tax=Aquicella siphonis TaxID=254247 RepID=A0A5E4PH79_9COXI|nr:hypothetical protein [Aquicella siphonis]VVC76264.1 hypothetical protein AQUSIP_15730 [Aquicella siphonis]